MTQPGDSNSGLIGTNTLTSAEKADAVQPPSLEGWSISKGNRRFIKRRDGGPGVIYQRDNESPDDAWERWQREEADGTNERNRAGKGRRRGRRSGADPKPNAGRVKSGPPQPADGDLERMLGEVLAFPAIPSAVFLHCEFCATHFATQASPTAHQLVMLSKDNPDMRRMLVRLYGAFTSLTYGGIIAMYMAKPLLHHLAPDPVLAVAGPVLGVPPREPQQYSPPPAHQHGQADPYAHVRPREAPSAQSAESAASAAAQAAYGFGPADS